MTALRQPIDDDWGVYVHLPFCQVRCTYCDFNTITSMGEKDHPAYVDALLAEWARAPLPGGRLISVFFGGGTPSLVAPRLIARVVEAILERVGNAWMPALEITLEVNPGTVTEERLAGYRAAGVNRLSIGAQAFQDHHLQALNRIHGVQDIVSTVTLARKAGFDNLNLDAIYGLPGQVLAEWQKTIEGLLEMAPEHLSLYQLQVEEGTPLANGVGSGSLRLPGDDLTADMAAWAERRLPEAGFIQYEISNYSRPGRYSRHNRLYWTLNPYIGIGAGAHSYYRQRRWWNVRNVRRYRDSALRGEPVIAGEERLSGDEEVREYLWLGLRLLEGVDRRRFAGRFGADPMELVGPALGRLQALGLVQSDSRRLFLSRRGRDVANVVFRALVDAEVTILDIRK